jgi:microcystin-dependent protein
MAIPAGSVIGETQIILDRLYQWDGDKWSYIADINYYNLIGEIKMWPTNTAPEKYLFCDGAAISRSTYAELFNVIGTRYGSGDGSTTFNLPNFMNRIPVGSGNLYGENFTGGLKDTTIVVSHTHSVGGTTGNQSSNHTHSVIANGDHTHYPASGGFWMCSNTYINNDDPTVDGSDNSWYAKYVSGATNFSGSHNHSGWLGSNSATHTHTLSGNTDYAGTIASNANLPPYRGIHFIIKYQ